MIRMLPSTIHAIEQYYDSDNIGAQQLIEKELSAFDITVSHAVEEEKYHNVDSVKCDSTAQAMLYTC